MLLSQMLLRPGPGPGPGPGPDLVRSLTRGTYELLAGDASPHEHHSESLIHLDPQNSEELQTIEKWSTIQKPSPKLCVIDRARSTC